MVTEHAHWSVGKQLQRWRRAANLSAVQVAAALDVTQQTISNWEVDATRPHVKRSRELEDLYSLSPGLVTAILSGDAPPADAADPDAVDILEGGRVLWSARRLIHESEEEIEAGASTPTERAIATDADLTDEQKSAMLAIYRSFQGDTLLRPSPEAEPEGP